MKKISIWSILAVQMLFIGVIAANALPVNFDATVTADNHYALYMGNENHLTYIGRNELGSVGEPGRCNWSEAEVFNFNVDSGDYIYVAAWSDDSGAQGWIGSFVSEYGTILSNTTGWEVFLTFNDLDNDSIAPTTLELQYQLQSAVWEDVTYYLEHGSIPWGYIDGIPPSADWIWGSPLIEAPGDYGEYQIFRAQVSQVAPVPEPSTMILLGSGLAGLAGFRRKQTKI